MFTERKLSRSLLVLATVAAYAFMTQSAAARGGGYGGGGHGGGHAGGHHGGEHNHHPYHPSHHHEEHHASHHDHHHDDHHHVAHHNHHHENWHHGVWGPGFWGGAGLGYGLGYAYGNWDGYGYGGGDTYVDNSTNVTPTSDETAADDSSDAADDSTASDDENNTAGSNGDRGFPTDDWPELGVVTYAGEYGASQGQVIVRIVPGSAAEKAGLVPGDVILTFNGKPVPSADDLDEAFDTANGKFEVLVWDARTGRKSTISGTLELAATPEPNETAAIAPAQQ